MRTVGVTSPTGTAWSVRVVWAPRWRILARRFGGWRSKRTETPGDVVDGTMQVASNVPPSGGGGGGGGGFFSLDNELAVIAFILIGFVLAAVLFWWVLLPLLLLVLDGMIVLLLLAVSVVARVLFRRPWTVEATAPGETLIAQEVVGWRAALRRRDEIADALARGLRPEPMPSPLQR
ncbi:hypothetical protein ACQPZX_29030 [Actinoplanes sp. CA-142083]|uniref:hypothetical protein n=1 Tax=Actinoplanes sp. CA-142083 TaxID=3239903 RepID=UPI003D949050